MTLNKEESTTIENIPTHLEEPWNSIDLKEDFSYWHQLMMQGERNTEMIKNQALRLAKSIAVACFEAKQDEFVTTIESKLKTYAHDREIFSYDELLTSLFNSQVWRDTIHNIEQSYGRFGIASNNLLYQRRSPGTKSESVDSLKSALKWAQQNPSAIPDDMKRDFISSMDKTRNIIQKEAIHSGLAIYPPETEVEQTRAASMEKKEQQLKTPEYRIEEIHKQRQAIIKEGLKAVIDVFTEMHDHTVNEIPIQSDEEAYMIRDGFVDLANNYTSMSDDKHRMDFAGWAKTLENIKNYGAEKGLKMSGTEITDKDIEMIDENTLPINYYPKYNKVGLSYISKEHLDSKGVIIANCFIDMMNRFAWQQAGAALFSYQAKIRGIRAIAVSHKLMGTR